MSRRSHAYLVVEEANPENQRTLFGMKEVAEYTRASLSLVQKVASNHARNKYFKRAKGYIIEDLGEWQ